jgi:quercetin dioxygenase-like cupin family protein
MKAFEPSDAVRMAVAASPSRPATAVLLDSPDVRLVVFRIEPGQSVAPHHSASTVLLTVLEGEGFLLGAEGDRHCRAGDVIAYAPGETHAMRATDQTFKLLATIAPRPGERRTS